MTVPDVLTVRAVYQPIVELAGRRQVAVEALARVLAGPEGLPARLFAEAAATGGVARLDEACLRAGLHGMRDVPGPATLFLNIEPETLSTLSQDCLAELAALAPPDVAVVLEVTERALLQRPAELVRGVARVRELGWAVALDDVGAEPGGLALMPFLEPDVIKLDLGLVRGRTTLEAAAVVNAVRAQAERSGALVLAEGIETEQQLERALGMGATLGQGWLFGHPGPLALDGTVLRLPRTPAPVAAPVRALTPFDVLGAGRPPSVAPVALMAAITRHLEHQALLLDEQAVVLTCFQHARHLTPRTLHRYAALARATALTAAVGIGMPDEPAPGVHGSALEPDDPLADQWGIVVIGPHFAAALAAREVVGTGTADDTSRRLEHVLTYDRDRVLAAGRLLLSRVRPRRAALPAPATDAQGVGALLRVPATDLPHLLLRAISRAPHGIVIADARLPDQPLVYANEAFLRLTGYTEDEVLGRNCRLLQGPHTDPAAVRPLARQLLAGREVRTVVLNYRRDGTPFWNDLSISPVHDEGGEVTHFVGNQEDVTERVERERRTTWLAYHDELTGLPNRVSLLEHLELELRRARRSGLGVALVLLDLDGFKEVNDVQGHAAGDLALVAVAQRLTGAVRAGDLFGRLGGDEFLVVLAGLPSDREQARVVVDTVRSHLHAALRGPVDLLRTTTTLHASSGVAQHPGDADSAPALLAVADADMYAHKRAR